MVRTVAAMSPRTVKVFTSPSTSDLPSPPVLLNCEYGTVPSAPLTNLPTPAESNSAIVAAGELQLLARRGLPATEVDVAVAAAAALTLSEKALFVCLAASKVILSTSKPTPLSVVAKSGAAALENLSVTRSPSKSVQVAVCPAMTTEAGAMRDSRCSMELIFMARERCG